MMLFVNEYEYALERRTHDKSLGFWQVIQQNVPVTIYIDTPAEDTIADENQYYSGLNILNVEKHCVTFTRLVGHNRETSANCL